MSERPPDVPGETEPPDLRLGLRAARMLLEDTDDHLRHRNHDPDDLLLRIAAVTAVLRRLGDDDDSE